MKAKSKPRYKLGGGRLPAPTYKLGVTMKLNTRGVAIVTALSTAWLYTAALMLKHVLFDLGEYEAPTYPAWQLTIFTVTTFAIIGYTWAIALNPKRN